VRVYGPPLDHHIGLNGPEFSLSWGNSRTKVPQPPYECGNTQKDWVAKPPIHFFTQDCLGVRLLNARDGTFKGVNDGDKPPFDMVCCGITIRIHVGLYGRRVSANNSSYFQFPGYPSSTEVEKKLKHSGGTKARSMQVRGGRWEPKRIVSSLITALDRSPPGITSFRPVQWSKASYSKKSPSASSGILRTSGLILM
jgi:hypothetical protein